MVFFFFFFFFFCFFGDLITFHKDDDDRREILRAKVEEEEAPLQKTNEPSTTTTQRRCAKKMRPKNHRAGARIIVRVVVVVVAAAAVTHFETTVLATTTTTTHSPSGGGGSHPHNAGKDGIPVSNTVNVDPLSVAQMSWQPNAARYAGFLSSSECDYLIEKVSSSESSSAGKKGVGAVVEREQDPVVRDIERRIAEWTHTPSSHGEKLRVVKHDLTSSKTTLKPLYSEVYPTFEEEKNVGRINDMHLGTVVLILKDESKKEREEEFSSNGVIMFPNGGGKHTPTTCEDIDESLFIKAKRGDAIAWLHATRDQKVDGNATGVGECVYKGGKVGEKWTAVKYLHLVTTSR